MKKSFLTLLAFILFTACMAQETEITRTYEVRSNIPAWPSDILGKRVPGVCDDYCVPWYRSKFAVVRAVDSGMIVVRFLDWYRYRRNIKSRELPIQSRSDTSRPKTTQLAEVTTVQDTGFSRHRYFVITRNDLDSNCVMVFERGTKNIVFTLGLVTMPLKLRLGKNFDFQGSFTLGTTAGAKMRISKYNPHYVNFLFSAAISTVSLDSFSTGGRVPGQPLNNIATFSPSFGCVFEFGRAQAGFFYGWDIISRSMDERYRWLYNKKPWISVGFGFSIFNIDTQKKSPSDDLKNSPASKGKD